MATYNGAAYLREQIDSVLAQLQPGDELLIADDASKDDTPLILSSYGDALSVVASSRAGGVVRNFERVLQRAVGDIVVLVDQDDVWLPGRLARLRSELASCDLVVANAWVVDAALQGRTRTVFDQLRAAPGVLRNWCGRSSFVGCCMAFRIGLLRRALPFPALTPWHDWLLGLLASVSGRVRFIDEPLMLFRRHGANASQTGDESSNGIVTKAVLRLRVGIALVRCLLRARGRSRPGT